MRRGEGDAEAGGKLEGRELGPGVLALCGVDGLNEQSKRQKRISVRPSATTSPLVIRRVDDGDRARLLVELDHVLDVLGRPRRGAGRGVPVLGRLEARRAALDAGAVLRGHDAGGL